MNWLDRLVAWLSPRLLLTEPALRDKWDQEDRERVRRLVRGVLPAAAVLMMAHYLAIDLHLGLGLSPRVIIYRWGATLIMLVTWLAYSPKRFPQMKDPRITFEVNTVVGTLGLVWMMPLYPGCPPFLPGLLACTLSSLCLASPFRTAMVLGPLLAAVHVCMVRMGFDPLVLGSVAFTGFIFVVFFRGQSHDVGTFIMAENAEQLKRESNAKSLQIAEELLTICPREIKRRVIKLVEAKQLSAFQCVDEVMKIRRKEISCLTSDIRGYTSASKDLNFVVKDVIGNIQMCTEIVEDFGGIPALTGDGIFVIIDEPTPPINHLLAALTGFKIAGANHAWNKDIEEESARVRRFVTMASGEAAVGNIGGAESARLYTALGTPANLVSRIDQLTKAPELANTLRQVGPQLILSNSAYQKLKASAPLLQFVTYDLHAKDLVIRDFEEEKCLYFLEASLSNQNYLTSCLNASLKEISVHKSFDEFKTSRQRPGKYSLTGLGTAATSLRPGQLSTQEPDSEVTERAKATLYASNDPNKTAPIEATVWRHWPFGIDVIVPRETPEDNFQNIEINFNIEGQSHRFNGTVAAVEKSPQHAGKLVAIRFHRAHEAESPSAEKRRQERWTCSPLNFPTGIAPHPLNDNDFFIFRVKDVSVGGMQILTNTANRAVGEGSVLEAMLTFPQTGKFFSKLQVRGSRLVRDNGAPALALNVELLSITPLILEIIGRYTEQFSAEAVSFEASPFASLGAIRGEAHPRSLFFRYASTEHDFYQVRQLRRHAADMSNAPGSAEAPVSDVFDSRSRILTAHHGQRVVASTRIRKLDVGDEAEPVSFCLSHSVSVKTSATVEVSWTVCHPDQNEEKTITALFGETINAAINMGRQYLIGSAPLEHLWLYRRFGCRFVSKDNFLPHKFGKIHQVYVCDIFSLISGNHISPLLWSLFFNRHRGDVRRLVVGSLSALAAAQLTLNFAMAPSLFPIAERRYLRISRQSSSGQVKRSEA
jgi:class 3 adenylate cyclase